MIPHMVIDNIIAYKRAIEATTTAQVHQDWEELMHCSEDEQLKLDGLLAVINIAIAEAARADPYSPDAINGDVNQAPEPAPQPRSRLEQAMAEDPQVRVSTPDIGHADFDTGLMATLRNLKHLAQSEPPKPTVLDKLKADPEVAPVFEHLPPPLPEED